jgi:hypothetical protein
MSNRWDRHRLLHDGRGAGGTNNLTITLSSSLAQPKSPFTASKIFKGWLLTASAYNQHILFLHAISGCNTRLLFSLRFISSTRRPLLLQPGQRPPLHPQQHAEHNHDSSSYPIKYSSSEGTNLTGASQPGSHQLLTSRWILWAAIARLCAVKSAAVSSLASLPLVQHAASNSSIHNLRR